RPASADFMINLHNGETIRAKDYKITGWKINLKMEDGSASFPNSIVASISWAEPLRNPPSPPEAWSSTAPAPSAFAPSETGEHIAEEDMPQSSADEPEKGKPSVDNMTVEEFLDIEAVNGDNTYENSGQDDSRDCQGFMKEDSCGEDNATGK
ncbi:MAG: hypothetical protein ACYDFU_09620, partial [Nitrospirota bacterium]